jgi:hypothetical protein
MHSQSLAHCKERRVFSIGQEHSRSLDLAHWLRSRPRYHLQSQQVFFPNANSSTRRYADTTFHLVQSANSHFHFPHSFWFPDRRK